MHRLSCECGQSFSSHTLDGRPRERCPLCHRPVSAANEQAVTAIIVDEYPYRTTPRPAEPFQEVRASRPFFVSAAAIIGLCVMFFIGGLTWFACVVAVSRNGRSMVAGIAAGITTALVLGGLVSSVGSIVSVVIRRRIDNATVAGWVVGSVSGPLVLSAVGHSWASYVMQTHPPKSMAPLIVLTTLVLGAVTSIGFAIAIPQLLHRRSSTNS
jgi:hypothetical protein